MKNYCQEIDRKFTFGKLELRSLSVSDSIILALYSSSIAIQFSVGLIDPTKKFFGLWIISFTVGIVTVSTPFGIRFRGIYFSLLWLILSLIFLYNGTSLSKIPLYTLLFYHFLRIIFWRRHDKEFIPFEAERNGYIRYVSKIEGRGGSKDDKKYMRVLLWGGIILIMYCVFGIAGVDLKQI